MSDYGERVALVGTMAEAEDVMFSLSMVGIQSTIDSIVEPSNPETGVGIWVAEEDAGRARMHLIVMPGVAGGEAVNQARAGYLFGRGRVPSRIAIIFLLMTLAVLLAFALATELF